jgi:alcohol dehydrogenase
VANSIFLPFVLAYNLPACFGKMAVLARHSGIEEPDDETASKKFIQTIKDLSQRLKIPCFKELNIGRDRFDKIAAMSFENNSTPSNPRELDHKDYLKILESAYE